MDKFLRTPYELSVWEDKHVTEYWLNDTDNAVIAKEVLEKSGPFYGQDDFESYNTTHQDNQILIGADCNAVTYYKEIKTAIIGSDTMDTPIRAFEPKLTQNTNGQITLDFNFYFKYYDEDTDELVDNPFRKYLVNERKLKLHYKDKWYDFIIKSVKENSDNYTCSVQATSLHINELSKTGFNITLDNELKNSTGTVFELADTILENTDWVVDKDNKPNLYENQREPVYKYTLTNNGLSNVHRVLTDETLEGGIAKNKIIWVFYQSVKGLEEGKSDRLQFVYLDGNISKDNTDDDWTFIDDNFVYQFYVDNAKIENGYLYVEDTQIAATPKMTDGAQVFYAKKLVKSTNYEYEPVLKKVVTVCSQEGSDEPVYRYEDTEYSTSTLVQSYIQPSNYFITEEGWRAGNLKEVAPYTEPRVSLYPGTEHLDDKFQDFLWLGSGKRALYTGFYDSLRAEKTGFTKGTKMVMRMAYGTSYYKDYLIPYKDGNRPLLEPAKHATVQIADYTIVKIVQPKKYYIKNSNNTYTYINDYKHELDSSKAYYTKSGSTYTAISYLNVEYIETFNIIKTYYTFNNFQAEDAYFEDDSELNAKYYYSIASCADSLSYTDLLSKIRKNGSTKTTNVNVGLFITLPSLPSVVVDDETLNQAYFLQSGECFLYQENEDGSFVKPGEPCEAQVRTKYTYYTVPDGAKEAEEIVKLSEGYELNNSYPEAARENTRNFEKVRTVKGKESNRFNLIQNICETFECWADFQIAHESNGAISLITETDDDGNVIGKRQDKKIVFKDYVGKDNYAGFHYGINLKSIERDNDSKAFVSKLIVKENTNSVATNGICTIARAKDNPILAEFIINFDYYVAQGMLDRGEVNADLYLTNNGHIGYYEKYRENTIKYQENATALSQINTNIDKMNSQLTTYKEGYDSSSASKSQMRAELIDLCGLGRAATDEDIKAKVSGTYKKHAGVQDRWNQYQVYSNNLVRYEKLINDIEIELNGNDDGSIPGAIKEQELLKEEQESIVNTLEELDLAFYKKYSRFIQEGTWTSNEYVDDNLYYLDATSVMQTSSVPQTSYSINVIELSEVEEYENFAYEVGDKTYVIDTEFFGYVYNNNVKSPKKQDVIISETTDYLDEPEKNTLKIQNYKTQFEDLFQRVAATSQAVQYSQGDYDRASNAVNSDGTINASILQTSIENNAFLLSNARNQSVEIGDNGIVTTNLGATNEVLKISSGGIIVSSDGGKTWTTGISAGGINTQLLTAGRINADDIYIYNGSFPSFKWDNAGITAIGFNDNGSVDVNRLVRFDQYGFYGLNGQTDYSWKPSGNTVADKLQNIEDNAAFGLTWDSFFFKAEHIVDGSTGFYGTKISKTDDIQVIADDKERIKIGLLDNTDDIYGIQIKDNDENVVMENGSDGNLWLKNILKVGDGSTSTVSIGYGETKREGTDSHEVIHAGIGSNSEFIVYEDGYFIANGGKIGNLNVEQISDIGAQIAQFSVLSNSIQAAINNSKLEFNEGGLHIYNGGLDITKDIYVEVEDTSKMEYQLEPDKYYELIDDEYVLTTDQQINPDKTYYDSDHNIVPHEQISMVLRVGKYFVFDDDTGAYVQTSDKSPAQGTTYYEKDKQAVLEADGDGDLIITGTIYATDGEFKGTVYANDGYFKGTVYANDGTLGDLNVIGNLDVGDISEGTIRIDGKGGTISSSNYDENNGFELSKDGSIVANKITLGNNAKIKNYILMGENENKDRAWLFNPSIDSYSENIVKDAYSKGDALVLQKQNERTIVLNIDGTLDLLNGGRINVYNNDSQGIVIDSESTSIRATNNSWSISPDRAIFNNISARGSIEAAVFEQGATQAIGGMILVRPSTIVLGIKEDNKTVIVENAKIFNSGDYCYIGKNRIQCKIDSVTENEITLENAVDTNEKDNIINYPLISMISGEEKIGIGINSTRSDSLLPNHSISMFETSVNNEGKFKIDNKIIIGKISGYLSEGFIPENNVYGLYAEDAYLNGQIISYGSTTEDSVTTHYYAGINTKSNVKMPNEEYFPNSTIGNIVMWAGKRDDTQKNDAAMKAANFKVDTYGNLYANSAYFEGTIISNSYIEAAEIRTARIVGTGTDSYGLELFNTDNALNFEYLDEVQNPSGNPNVKGYYESKGEGTHKYKLTSDTEVVTDKKYYEKVLKMNLTNDKFSVNVPTSLNILAADSGKIKTLSADEYHFNTENPSASYFKYENNKLNYYNNSTENKKALFSINTDEFNIESGETKIKSQKVTMQSNDVYFNNGETNESNLVELHFKAASDGDGYEIFAI